MAMRALDAPHGVVERAAELALERLEGEHAIRVAELIRRYWERVAPDDLLARDPADLFGAAMAHWQTGARRLPDQAPNVRLYNPDLEVDGWESRHTVVEVVCDDLPFLVDSVTMVLQRHGWGIHLVVHPVLAVERTADGDARRPGRRHPGVVDPPGDRSPGQPGAARSTSARTSWPCSTTSGRRSTDWPAMRPGRRPRRASWRPFAGRRCRPRNVRRPRSCSTGWWTTTSRSSATGSTSWSPTRRTAGGAARRARQRPRCAARRQAATAPSRLVADLPELVRARLHEPTLLLVTKANARSTGPPPRLPRVRRRQGSTTAARWPASAASSASTPPWPTGPAPSTSRSCGARSHAVLDAVGSRSAQPRRPGAVEHPGDLPARRAVPDRRRRAVRHRHRHPEPAGAQPGAPVRPPRPLRPLRLVPGVRAAGPLQTARSSSRWRTCCCRPTAGPSTEHDTLISESVLARLHFLVSTAPDAPEPPSTSPRSSAAWPTVTRWWIDDLRDALVVARSARTRACRAGRFGEAFPAPTASSTARGRGHRHPPAGGARTTRASTTALYRPVEAAPSELRLKLYTEGQAVSLSAVLPLLEHMGVQVTDERPYELRSPTAASVWLYDFGLRLRPAPRSTPTSGGRDEFAGHLRRSLAGRDRERRLQPARPAGRACPAARSTVLRAYAKYLRQAGTTFSQRYVEDTLAAHPAIARKLVELFALRFDPDAGRSRRAVEVLGPGRPSSATTSTRWPASTRTASCAGS